MRHGRSLVNRMIPELKTASRIVSKRLKKRPYQRGVTITAWNAVVDQLLSGSRYGAFSWHNAVEKEVRNYITELGDDEKRRIWISTDDAKLISNASIETITECLYPYVFDAAQRPIRRAVRRRQRNSEQE